MIKKKMGAEKTKKQITAEVKFRKETISLLKGIVDRLEFLVQSQKRQG